MMGEADNPPHLVDQLACLVRIKIKSSSNIGLVYNLLCIIGEDHVSHGMAHIISESNKTPTPFSRVRRKTSIIHLKVHRFPPSKAEKRADIRCGTSQYLHWCAPIEGCWGSKVQDKAYIHQCKEPGLWGRSCGIHNSVRHPFDILVLAFSRILMLLMGFNLPIANDEGPEDILNSAADFDLGTVANKLGGSARTSNHILQGVDKCLFGFQGIYITDGEGETNKKLGNGHTRVNCRDIRVHNVGGKCFFTAVDIQCGEWRLG
jgi:hypothetical protein